ncbi:ABC transporter permease [Phytohabitans rumicis]|uniref:ABC transporter permease n=1 Tax=Phytohabitans rumicis TaxID=1076125 RepID=A0A6V8LE36_9ACTN|nr:ABC transporter permease [Phytohabitans rumicis]
MAGVLVALTAYAAIGAYAGKLGTGKAVVTASIRATVQLIAVSAVIVAVLRHGLLTVAFVTLMYVVATLTSARRVAENWSAWWIPAAAIATGVVPVLVLLLASGLVPLRGISVVPIAGILIGGAMTATSLAGRRARDELRTRHGEYEAGLALGLLRRDAALEICRPTAATALVPALDQTRTVGLVTLPGAFVGVLLGGASPVQAGAIQLLVLIGLLAVEVAAIIVTIEGVCASGRV